MRYSNRSKQRSEEEAQELPALAVQVRAMLEEAARSHRQAQRRLAELEQALQDARRRRDADRAVVEAARIRRDRKAAVVLKLRVLSQRAQAVGVATCSVSARALERMRHEVAKNRAALQDRRKLLDHLRENRRRLLQLLEATHRVSAQPASTAQRQTEMARIRHAAARADKQAAEVLRDSCRTLVAHLHKVLSQATSVVVPTYTVPSTEADLQSLRQRHAEGQVRLREAQRAAQSQASQTSILRHIVDGATAVGMGAYLARASPEAKAIVQTCHREACDEGKARAGRRAHPAVDEEAAAKRRRKAERERERRRAAKQAMAALPAEERKRIEAERKTRHRKDRRERRQAEASAPDPILDGSRPRHRQHEERIEKAAPNKKALMTARLLTARERGHAAAVRDAAARGRYVEGRWQNAHPPLALPDGCKLIAVRGGRSDPDETMAAILEPGGLERWLREPAEERAKRMNGRARLVYTAGHITAAWSDILKDMARDGSSLEEAAAYRVDEAIARLDLAGHRVAAYWHTDSATGHPHLHIVWARVRDADLSLWSLESRSRATALWLHARSNTVLAAGPEALQDDVDALAGFGDAAVDAEVMMANDDIIAHRRLIDGTDQEILLQGDAAAGRVARVGAGPAFLAGGVWRFGLGPDPDLHRAWKKALAAAKRTGDKKQIDAVMEKRPPHRGYWLPLRGEAEGLQGILSSWGFGGYLSKQR